MIQKFKRWLRTYLFNLLKDDIKGMIVQEVCHLDPPTTVKSGWEVKLPELLERPKAVDCTYGIHRTVPGALEVNYFSGSHKKKACIPAPPEGVDVKAYLLGRPEARL